MPFIIVANWKMNGTRASFINFTNNLNNTIGNIRSKVIICPPFTAFPDKLKLHNDINIGAQNCHFAKSGSYTGEISIEMLKELGCSYVILGHSERKNEKDSEVKLKAEAVLEAGLHPIICLGERLEDHKAGKTYNIIKEQCQSRLPTHGNYIVAYEPIWSIGTGLLPNNDLISGVIEVIKSCSNSTNILYGGSVNLENIETLLDIAVLSGVLIGSASLNFNLFHAIVNIANNKKSLSSGHV